MVFLGNAHDRRLSEEGIAGLCFLQSLPQSLPTLLPLVINPMKYVISGWKLASLFAMVLMIPYPLMITGIFGRVSGSMLGTLYALPFGASWILFDGYSEFVPTEFIPRPIQFILVGVVSWVVFSLILWFPAVVVSVIWSPSRS